MLDEKFHQSPMYKLFFCFILDSIKELPQDEIEKIKSMNLPEKFKLNYQNWQDIVKHLLNLSDTIEIAIRDLWLKNSKISYENDVTPNSKEFAVQFIEKFFRKDSKVDVWINQEELIAAKRRISNSYLKD